MPGLFTFTERQLALDRVNARALLLLVPITLAIAWMTWLLLARIWVFATTNQARVEVAEAVYSVQAPVSGRVMQSHLDLGKEVQRGTVLVELESNPQKLRVEQEQTNETTLEAQIKDERRELAEEQHASAAERDASHLIVDQTRASLAESEEAVHMSQEELARKTELNKQGLLPELELLRAQSQLKTKQIELQSFRTAVARVEREQAIHQQEREARIDEMNAEIGRTEGEIANSGNAKQGLESELGSHRIVASVEGHLDEVANIKPGSYVEQGEQVAVIVPNGKFKIVAYFEPRSAIGRVKPGQSGRLRLDGFPWSEYGSVAAVVTSVGSEVRDGRVRVELNPRPNGRLSLQHGLPGTLDIQIERISPAVFLLRKAGLYLAQPVNGQVAAQ